VFLLVALVPWLNQLHIPLGAMAVWLFIVFSIPAHFFNVGWIPLIADVIPEQDRAGLVTARMMVNNATVSVFNFLFGQWLSHLPFPYNYSLMYVFGFTASLVSMWYLLKLQIPDSVPMPRPAARPRMDLAQARQALAEHTGLVRIILNTIFHGIGLWLAAPLYVLYYVRHLNASDAWIGLLGTVATLAAIIAVPGWQRIMRAWGKPVTLKRTIVLVGLFPIAVGLLPNLNVILLLAAVHNLVVPGVNLSHFTTLLEVTPEKTRPVATSWYISIVNIGAFICPLLGVLLADWIGLRTMLVFCGLLSCIGSFSFWIWPVQPAPSTQVSPA